MDIFEKIDGAEATTVEQSGAKYYYKDGYFGVVEQFDESLSDPAYEYIQTEVEPPDITYEVDDKPEIHHFWLLNSDYMQDGRKEYRDISDEKLSLYEELRSTILKSYPRIFYRRRYKAIEKILKKGINLNYYYDVGMSVMYQHMTDEEEILFRKYGYKFERLIKDLDKSKKLTYALLDEFDGWYELLFYPAHHVEKLINTRKGLNFDKKQTQLILPGLEFPKFDTEQGYLGKVTMWQEVGKTVEVLVKYGQIELLADQVKRLDSYLTQNGLQDQYPCLWGMITFARTIDAQADTNQIRAKYSQKSQISAQTSEARTEAVSEIDKLFEDAKNAVRIGE